MKQSPILKTWIDGCTQIRKVYGGYVFIWQRADGSRFEKEVKAKQVTNRAYDSNGILVNEKTMPIEVNAMQIIKASVPIKQSGKVVK